MPLPIPSKTENQDDFISRCIKFVKAENSKISNEQASAMCFTQWKEKGKAGVRGGDREGDRNRPLKTSELVNGYLLSQNAEPKKEIMLFPYGEFEHPTYGKLNFDNKFFLEIIENYEKKVMSTMPFIDEGHNEGKSFAWFTTAPFIRQGKGLFARPEWTKNGEQKVSEKEYMYFSPWWGKYVDPQTKKEYKNVFKGGAATNIPFLKTMPSLSDDTSLEDKESDIEIKLSEIINIQSDDFLAGGNTDEGDKKSKSGKNKNIQNIIKEADMPKKLRELLIKQYKLDENSTDEQIEKAVEKSEESDIEKIKKENEDLKKENEELKKEPENKEANKDDENKENKELAEKLNKTEKEILNLTLKLTSTEKEKFLTEFVGKKILPRDKDYWDKQFMADPVGSKERVMHMADLNLFQESGISTDTGENMNDDKLMSEAKIIFEKEREHNKHITLSDCIIKARQNDPSLGKEYEEKYLNARVGHINKF